MAFPMLLMAAQASGLAANLWQTSRENKFDMLGTKMQQREMDLQMQQISLASSQESLFNMERLKENMSSQRAIFAAKGQSAGQGSNYFIGQNSIRAFNADEQARELSLGFQKYYVKSKQNLMGFESRSRATSRNMKSIGQGLNMMSFNSFGDGKINDLLKNLTKGFGKSWSGLND